MSGYSTFSRFLVFASLIDAISRVDSTGPIETPPLDNLNKLHAGADAVASVCISLARDYSLATSNPNYSLEAAFAVSRLLEKSDVMRSGEVADLDAGTIRFDCTIGAGSGSAIRIQYSLPEKSRFEFFPKNNFDGQLGVFQSEGITFPLSDVSCTDLPGAGIQLLLADKEVLSIVSDGGGFDLLTLTALFQAGVSAQVFYHTLVARFGEQEVTLVLKPDSGKVSLSLVSECLFEADMG